MLPQQAKPQPRVKAQLLLRFLQETTSIAHLCPPLPLLSLPSWLGALHPMIPPAHSRQCTVRGGGGKPLLQGGHLGLPQPSPGQWLTSQEKMLTLGSHTTWETSNIYSSWPYTPL